MNKNNHIRDGANEDQVEDVRQSVTRGDEQVMSS